MRPPNRSVQIPSGTRINEPVNTGMAVSSPNSVELRPSDFLIGIPITPNIIQTMKHTVKASVLTISMASACPFFVMTTPLIGWSQCTARPQGPESFGRSIQATHWNYGRPLRHSSKELLHRPDGVRNSRHTGEGDRRKYRAWYPVLSWIYMRCRVRKRRCKGRQAGSRIKRRSAACTYGEARIHWFGEWQARRAPFHAPCTVCRLKSPIDVTAFASGLPDAISVVLWPVIAWNRPS